MFHKTYDNLPNSQFHTCRTQIASPVAAVFGLRSAVIVCLMGFSGGFSRFFVWSFSMLCSLRFLAWGLLANGGLKLMGVDGAKTLD